VPKLAFMPDEALANELMSPNGWVRDTAQRLLVERESKWARPSLSGSPAAKVQQLWTMHSLGTLSSVVLRNAMRDKDARVREHAVRAAENHLADPTVLQAMCDLAKDPELRVRVQVAFSLGESKDERVAAVLGDLAKQDASTPAMLVAVLSSAPAHADAKQWQAALRDAQKVGSGAAAAKIITNANPDRDRVVKAYAGVDKLTGDPARGHVLYTAICSVCHRLKNEGNEIGPDLGTIAGKPTEQLLEAILDPNRAVELRYLAQMVTLKDGRKLMGMIADESANSITLKLGATTEVLLRKQVASREAGTKSLMPDGLESLLNAQQVADVLAWIRAK
jgi:putative heme-binding domain-containing protein